MKHYFLQHGKAVSKDIDETRPLSDTGVNETRAIAKILHKNNIQILAIRHSGKQRAAQTAKIIATELAISDITEITGMSPNDDVAAFSKSQLSPNTNGTLYVGHLPHLGKLVSYMLSNQETLNCITFKNSAIACIESSESTASLLWYITPDTI